MVCEDSPHPPSSQGNTGISLKMVRGTQVPLRAGHKLQQWKDAGALWEKSISSVRGLVNVGQIHEEKATE